MCVCMCIYIIEKLNKLSFGYYKFISVGKEKPASSEVAGFSLLAEINF